MITAQLHTAMISKTAPDIADLFAGSYLSTLIPYLTDLNSGVGVALLKRLIHLGYLPQNAMYELGELAKRRDRRHSTAARCNPHATEAGKDWGSGPAPIHGASS